MITWRDARRNARSVGMPAAKSSLWWWTKVWMLRKPTSRSPRKIWRAIGTRACESTGIDPRPSQGATAREDAPQ